MRQEGNKIILTKKEFSDIRGYNELAVKLIKKLINELNKIQKEFSEIRGCNELVNKLNKLNKLQDEKLQLLERHIGYKRRY